MTLMTDSAETQAGTLALLIALILVGAVTVGVLVNTIPVLQNGSSQTEAEAVEVADAAVAVNEPSAESVEVSDDIGSDDGNPVGYQLELELLPVSNRVDLTNLTVEYETEGGFGNITHISRNVDGGDFDPDGDVAETSVARDVFFVRPIAAQTVDGTMTRGDRYELVIPTGVFIAHDGTVERTPTEDARVVAPARAYDDPDVAVRIPDLLDSGEGIDNSGLRLLERGNRVTLRVRAEGEVIARVELEIPSLEDHAGDTVSVQTQ